MLLGYQFASLTTIYSHRADEHQRPWHTHHLQRIAQVNSALVVDIEEQLLLRPAIRPRGDFRN